MIRRNFCTVILAVAVAGCASNPLLPGEIHFSYAELSARMAQRFPIDKSVAGLLDVTLSNPRVVRREDGTQARLGATFDVQVRVPLTGKTMYGSLAMSGIPRYDGASRTLYFGGARVDTLRADNMPDALSAALGKAAASIARDYLEEKPLYVLKEEQLQRYGVALNPQRIEVRTEGIALIMR